MPLPNVTMRAPFSSFVSTTKPGTTRWWSAPTSRSASQTRSGLASTWISLRIEAIEMPPWNDGREPPRPYGGFLVAGDATAPLGENCCSGRGRRRPTPRRDLRVDAGQHADDRLRRPRRGADAAGRADRVGRASRRAMREVAAVDRAAGARRDQRADARRVLPYREH